MFNLMLYISLVGLCVCIRNYCNYMQSRWQPKDNYSQERRTAHQQIQSIRYGEIMQDSRHHTTIQQRGTRNLSLLHNESRSGACQIRRDHRGGFDRRGDLLTM